MARHAFYSLHYDADRSRVAALRTAKVLEANLEVKPAEWDKIARSGDFAFKRWVENELRGRSCTVVWIGAKTASRPKILYEIKRSFELGLGLLGVHIHHLKDAKGQTSDKGDDPFVHAGLADAAQQTLVIDPPETESDLVYRHIHDQLRDWAEQAVALRHT